MQSVQLQVSPGVTCLVTGCIHVLTWAHPIGTLVSQPCVFCTTFPLCPIILCQLFMHANLHSVVHPVHLQVNPGVTCHHDSMVLPSDCPMQFIQPMLFRLTQLHTCDTCAAYYLHTCYNTMFGGITSTIAVLVCTWGTR